MRILFTFDTGYAPHAATVMESIIQNCPEKLDFAVIYYDLNNNIQRILTNHFAEKIKSIEFYQIDESVFAKVKNAKMLPWISLSTYLRLFTPMILTNDNHVIYLDCDILVQDNILNILNNADLSKPVCAVAEYDSAYKYRNVSDFELTKKAFVSPFIEEAYWYRTLMNLKMRPDAKYFNAGIMVINLSYWREHNIAEKALAFLLENPDKVFAVDQDALNHAINGDFHALHPKWNTAGTGGYELSGYSTQEIKESLSHPSIIHSVGPIKPWHYNYYTVSPKHQKKYKKYRNMTPWPKIEYKNVSTRQVLGKYLFCPMKRIVKKLLTFLTGKKLHSVVSFLGLNTSVNTHRAKMRL